MDLRPFLFLGPNQATEPSLIFPVMPSKKGLFCPPQNWFSFGFPQNQRGTWCPQKRHTHLDLGRPFKQVLIVTRLSFAEASNDPHTEDHPYFAVIHKSGNQTCANPDHHMDMGHNDTRGPQVLVHVSIYQVSFWVPIFYPHPYLQGTWQRIGEPQLHAFRGRQSLGRSGSEARDAHGVKFWSAAGVLSLESATCGVCVNGARGCWIPWCILPRDVRTF